MEGSIEMVGRQMCDECDAFLGKPHAEDCSKSGLVEMTDATEKFTTPERAAIEDGPMLVLDAEGVELVLRSLIPPTVAGDDAEDLANLREALQAFLDAARELEAGEGS